MTERVMILDDSRDRHAPIAALHPNDDIEHCYSAAEALYALMTHDRFDRVYLDHDLGEEMSGCGVAWAIAHMELHMRPLVAVVHSVNPDGAKRMAQILWEDAGVDTYVVPFYQLVTVEAKSNG